VDLKKYSSAPLAGSFRKVAKGLPEWRRPAQEVIGNVANNFGNLDSRQRSEIHGGATRHSLSRWPLNRKSVGNVCVNSCQKCFHPLAISVYCNCH
jgi:hypothetical protein